MTTNHTTFEIAAVLLVTIVEIGFSFIVSIIVEIPYEIPYVQ